MTKIMKVISTELYNQLLSTASENEQKTHLPNPANLKKKEKALLKTKFKFR